MVKEIITFGDIEVDKDRFHQYRSPILIGEVNINEILVSKKVPFWEKRF